MFRNILVAVAMTVFWMGALALIPVWIAYGTTAALFAAGSVIIAGVVLMVV